MRGAFSTAGLDVADTGDDQNALCLRAGPELYYLDLWRGSEEFTHVAHRPQVGKDM